MDLGIYFSRRQRSVQPAAERQGRLVIGASRIAFAAAFSAER
jgi:hypothetical protein